MRRLLPAVVAVACVLFSACAEGPNGQIFEPEPGKDASTDSADALSPDAAPDALPDVKADSSPDAASDVSLDGVVEVGPDVASDATADKPDALPDASPDVSSDVSLDVTVDAVVDVAPDVPPGPLDPGVYSYTIVPSYDLLNPPAVAWHPSGDYALVLNANNKVFRYDRVSKTLAQVATTASTLAWRTVVFTPDGTKAVLLGNDTTAKEGRIYLWDHATSQLADMATEHFAGGTYESIAWSAAGTVARLLGAKVNPNIAYLWQFDIATGRSDVKATNSAAGCQDIAWATDQFDQPAVAVVCGGGVDLMHLNAGGQFVMSTANAGNTSRISARPQGDYALAICWSCNSKIYRFEQGAWQTPYASPLVQGGFQIGFSTNGARALVLGGTFNTKGQMYEYRHDLLSQSEIYDVSIPNFDAPPYNADSSVQLNDVGWRTGCEGGLIVGGSNTMSSQKGYLIQFSVDNGIPCN